MAMANENSNASSSGRESATLMTKIEIVSTAATRTSSLEKSRSPTWNAVSAGRSPSPTAILPNAVAEPVGHHHRLARALVHDGAHERARRGGRPPSRSEVGSTVLAADIDSPVSTPSSHSSWFASMSRTSAGTRSPTLRLDDVAWHQLAHVEALWRAVAPDQGLVVDVGVQRGDRELGAVLVDEAEPDAQDDDRGDDRAVDGVTRGRGDRRRRRAAGSAAGCGADGRGRRTR